ncbi:ICMT-domain-containing protein [Ganoderma leucocontextum]|nr:ICMT-domain-containing protein [Ganoderma leucocontextum]
MPCLAPLLCTPLLKIPLLVGNAALTHHGLTPPGSLPTTAKEWRRGDTTRDFMSKAGGTHGIVKACSATTKYVVTGLALAEVSVILAQCFPSAYSSRILTFLLPSDGTSEPSMELTPTSAIGSLLGIAGGLIRLSCHRALGRLFTWEMSVRDDHELITSGPYLVVRHPSYTGLALIACGNIMLLSSKGSYFVEAGLWNTVAGKALACSLSAYLTLITLSLFARAPEEDVMLRKEFGAQWDQWAKRTPWRVIPFIY